MCHRSRLTRACLCLCVGYITAYVMSFGQSVPAPDQLTEFSAHLWAANADSGAASIVNDTTRVRVGNASLRFTTDGGFDTWILTPIGRNASWNLSNSGGMAFWMYTENPNLGFQNNSPWILLFTTPNDYFRIQADYDILNEARDRWYEFRVPFTSSGVWRVTRVGNPSLSQIRWIEIHADTWGAGFVYWIDGLRFDLPPFPPNHQMVIAGNRQVWVSWSPVDHPSFLRYEIYRSTQPFRSVQGMTPIAVITNRLQTEYVDTNLTNGVQYHYAVAVRLQNGALSSEVESIARTPYDETDLQVVSIGRTPRFPRYDPIYTVSAIEEPSGFGPYITSIATGLGHGQDANTPRWPAVGSTVTYIATVRNRGTNPISGMARIRWLVDSIQVLEQQVMLNLAPREQRQFNLSQVWDNLDHEIRFTIEFSDARPQNNTMARTAKSVGFLSYIDWSYIENFREWSRGLTYASTDDAIDWLNRHMQRFNELFAARGVPKRVHYEILQPIRDAEPDPEIDTIYYAVFPFRYRATDGDLRQSGYYHPEDDIDYGLLHEWGHQLGLIDIYRLVVSSERNLVNGRSYSPVECLMNGVSPFLSEHSARAMLHWYETAHGYYGQYLYSLPATMRMQFFGIDNQPLANARVTVYQLCDRPDMGQVITDQVKFQGWTDANGYYVLPNVPIDPQIAPCAFNGDCLRPNPFGYIDVVGTNGLLLLKIERDGFTDYAWLDIIEANLAYWNGATELATFPRQVRLGGEIITCTPLDMTENNANQWTVSTVSGSAQIRNDSIRRRVGAASLRLDTDSGFDVWVSYPGHRLARWDLSQVAGVRFYAYAVNPNLGFQERSPWIILRGSDGYIELRPTYDMLNEARGQWREFYVPLSGDSVWQRTVYGNVSLANIQSIEIHADTWGSGFTLWLDGVQFDPPLRCAGDVNGDGCVDDADLLQVLFVFGTFGSNLPEDLNRDGIVDDADLLIVLFNFGAGC